MTDFDVSFLSHNRKPVCSPDPSFPNGKDFDACPDARVSCIAELPYPAECCGVWMVTCKSCGLRVGITAAGRPDDPRTVRLPCKASSPQETERGNG